VRIAIIGVGNVGGALARACNVAGHTVLISAKDPAHARRVADEVKVAAAGSNREAVQDAELAVLAVPAKAVALVLDDLAELVAGTIVVDPTIPTGRNRKAILRASASLAEAAVRLPPHARGPPVARGGG
jgi:predicted dinucleotide-binding enzyme